ncbi:sensor histidine kinase [Actinoplanes sp. TBRC 11911]|uniref:sensor histidine kinase n=1 Tax=Actinoplanes sp. TBRC 11911 TaxID=2729386 RepID=UPI00145E9322|nr:sensor histidine kinase [Actinoplanes sp. TBRC 11911]NMO52906.1 sensor histidine kinase [Actinoplanes sp. TBRC 11911]
MSRATLIHEAFVYDDDEDFVAALVPFLTDGLRDGEAVVAAVAKHNTNLLRRGLGDDADRVTFIDRDTWYVRPATTIAGWTDLLTSVRARGHESIRIIGEVAFGSRTRHDSWVRYESAVNDIFATAPAWIICPYDTRRLPGRIIADARRTHPVVTADRRGPSESYQQPADLLRTLAEPLPPISRAPLVTMSLDVPMGARRARYVVQAVAEGLGWPRPAIDDLLLAVTEIAVNSVIHGRAERHLSVWIEPTAITCEVTDHGDGLADPLVGYRPPAQSVEHGVGLWLAHQLSDWMATDRRDGTTRVRFRFTP